MNKNKRSGLNILVNFHRIIGISYMGWSFDGQMSIIKKALLTLWNVILLILISCVTYSTFKTIYSNEQGYSVKSLDGMKKSDINSTTVNDKNFCWYSFCSTLGSLALPFNRCSSVSF